MGLLTKMIIGNMLKGSFKFNSEAPKIKKLLAGTRAFYQIQLSWMIACLILPVKRTKERG